MRILSVDDDPLCLELVRFTLCSAGYTVEVIDNAKGALHLIEQHTPDLLILDVKMPEMDGFSFLEHLKKQGYTIPCIFLTSYAELEDRLRGFSLEAEDYICKPYHPQELIARIAAVSRRQVQTLRKNIKVGSLELIPEELLLVYENKRIPLTPTEMQVLLLLMNHVGKVVDRKIFLSEIWEDQTSNVLDVFIRRLRSKLGTLGKSIVCVRGVGYVLYI